MNSKAVKHSNGAPSQKTAGKVHLPDRIFRIAAAGAAALAVLLTLAFFVQLSVHSIPAFREFGIRFLWSTEWDTSSMQFGAASAIYGTLVTTIIALLIAVPTAFLTAGSSAACALFCNFFLDNLILIRIQNLPFVSDCL